MDLLDGLGRADTYVLNRLPGLQKLGVADGPLDQVPPVVLFARSILDPSFRGGIGEGQQLLIDAFQQI
jgi:hypothetical protein